SATSAVCYARAGLRKKVAPILCPSVGEILFSDRLGLLRGPLVALNEVGGPESDGPRVGLRLLFPVGDPGARAVGREHQPVGLGGADGLCRPCGRSVQNGPDECRPETLRKLEIIGTNDIAQAFDAASKRPTLREHKLPTSRSGIVK